MLTTLSIFFAPCLRSFDLFFSILLVPLGKIVLVSLSKPRGFVRGYVVFHFHFFTFFILMAEFLPVPA